MWVRYGAVGFLCSVTGQLDEIDVECYIMPKVEPFLRYPIILLKEKVGPFPYLHVSNFLYFNTLILP